MSKDLLHIEHVKKHSFTIDDFQKVKNDFNKIECLLFDTESCAINKENNSAKVYGWGLGITRSDNMVYGQNLEQFFNLLKLIAKTHYNTNKNDTDYTRNRKRKQGYEKVLYKTIPIAVHNLGWDIEFLKYYLWYHGYCYQNQQIKNIQTKTERYQSIEYEKQPMSFNICESDGQVYGIQIFSDVIGKVNVGKKTEAGIVYIFDFFDLFKIVTCAEENFNKYVNNVDDMFYKMSEDYDYDSIREDGHIQTMLELRYQYNDIYMMRKVTEQFYIDSLLNGNFNSNSPRTASSIAYAKLVEITFGLNDKGLPNKQGFNEHFEIGEHGCCNVHLKERIENKSYSGGFTHANYRFLNRVIYCNGSSLDINSSYPSQMAYKVFPYGQPIGIVRGKLPNLSIIRDKNKTFMTEIGFTWVKPKEERFNLEVFKIGGINIKSFNDAFGTKIGGNEYFATNIIDENEGKFVPMERHIGDKINGSYDDSDLFGKGVTYKMVVTKPELEFYLKHFDFGCASEEDLEEYDIDIKWNGLAYGYTLIYKAEKGLFKDYVEYFTKMKIENKKIGNKPMTASAKLFLNSAYGKLGTNVDKCMMQFTKIKGILQFDTKTKKSYKAKGYYKPYASYVTSYGRLQLWYAIIYGVGVENFLYCDTDSIYTRLPKQELINRMTSVGEKIDKTKLGAWDIEHEFDEFKMLGQKKYILHDINEGYDIRCCGLPKKVQDYIIGKISKKEALKESEEDKQARLLREKNCMETFKLGLTISPKYDEKGNLISCCKLARHKVVGGVLLLPTEYRVGLNYI